ncbi:MAG: PepSY domain-containing protein, partial [Rhodobacteraceae bacterium]|nr:PepSY domain-containing protein [Paracoccaceae bacterium]
MLRSLHKYFGLVSAVLVLVLALSGVALSVIPAWEKSQAPASAETHLSIANLAARVSANFPEVEQIKRAPSGRITAYYFADDTAGAVVIDPATGQGIADYAFSPIVRWIKDLHRSLLLGDGGRIAAAAGAFAMLVLSVSGLFLVARRMGGWRRIFAPARGTIATRLHVDTGRFSMVGLVITTLSAIFMTLGTFDILPQETANPPFPAEVSGEMGLSPAEMPALADIPVSELRSLTFPYADDPTDVFTVTTDRGEGFIDQGTGVMLSWQDAGTWQKVNEFIYLLHTGQGAWFWGLLLGLMVLGAPVLAITGVILWWVAHRSRPAL